MSLPESPDFDRLLDGLSGLARAEPGRDLMAGIEARIARPEAVILSAVQWRTLVAAAVILLFLNATALSYYSGWPGATDNPVALVTDYQLYD